MYSVLESVPTSNSVCNLFVTRFNVGIRIGRYEVLTTFDIMRGPEILL